MSDMPTPSLPEAARRYGTPRQKVPAFARFVGTSAWRKDRKRAREYALFRAAAKQAGQDAGTAGA